MVFVRSLLTFAALATAVVAAPTYEVSSGGSDCGSSGCGAQPDAASMMNDMSSTMMDDMSSTMMDDSSSTMMNDMSSTMMNDMSSTMMDDMSSTMMNDMSSTMMDDMSSTMMNDMTSTMMSEATSTMMTDAQTVAATSTAAYSMATYGSGSSGYNSNYNNCVQQCVAQFGMPSAAAMTATATASATTPEDTGVAGSPGTNGATHTVIVAPTQGVLRYVPFAVNASVGDTIKFEWHANVHTVTKSSALEICNKTSDAPFASGTHNNSFTFFQVVNDTNPTFFYCGTPGHCQKGMFGIINPPSTMVLPNQANSMMPAVQQSSNSTMSMASYAQSLASNSTVGAVASMWGANMDMSAIPSQYHQVFTENVQFTRAVIAMNPDIVSDGKVSLAAANGAPMMWPMDLAAASNAAATAAGAPVANAAPAAPSDSASMSMSMSASMSGMPSATPSPHNGARTLGASGALVAAAAGLAVFLL